MTNHQTFEPMRLQVKIIKRKYVPRALYYTGDGGGGGGEGQITSPL